MNPLGALAGKIFGGMLRDGVILELKAEIKNLEGKNRRLKRSLEKRNQQMEAARHIHDDNQKMYLEARAKINTLTQRINRIKNSNAFEVEEIDANPYGGAK